MSSRVTFFLAAVVFIVAIIVSVYYFGEKPENQIPAPEQQRLTFNFPETIVATYIEAVDWPPQIRTEEEAYDCVVAGEEVARAGKTEEKIINDRTYCVTTIAEGAAGSVYRQYAYSFPFEGETYFVTFSLRFPQCGNYEEEERLMCEKEQATFYVDNLIEGSIEMR